MNQAYLLLGGNSEQTCDHFRLALIELERKEAKVLSKSGVYRSPSWGYESADFLNVCVLLETNLNPISLLSRCMEIEIRLGRSRKETGGYQDRSIDIDILYFNQEVVQMEDLIIPHPRIYNRRFALVPMLEIAGDFLDPHFQSGIPELLKNCPDSSEVILTDIVL